jgi:hypothetical protein
MRGWLRLSAALAAIAAFALAAAYALGDEVIGSSPTCCSYSAPTFTITAGQVAQFHNGTVGGGIYGGVSHSVLANDTNTLHGQPLFASPIISSGQTAAVQGTQYLAPGDYVFHCAVHGPVMSAALHVAGGAPLARPRLGLAIASVKLDAARRTGKLRVRVSDRGSDARGVRLSATIARHHLRGAPALNVAAGSTARTTLRLSKATREALARRAKAKARVEATVPFGASEVAARTLR